MSILLDVLTVFRPRLEVEGLRDRSRELNRIEILTTIVESFGILSRRSTKKSCACFQTEVYVTTTKVSPRFERNTIFV